LSTTLERDHLVVKITSDLQQKLGVVRVVLYYFYYQWKGQVAFDALIDPQFSHYYHAARGRGISDRSFNSG
jgi:hypothetical protein